MYNYLRKDSAAAFTYLNPTTANGNGGVALWDTPPDISCANNAISFTRTKYLFLVEGLYDTPFDRSPNIVRCGDEVYLEFQKATASPLYVRLRLLDVNDEEVENTFLVYEGRTEWYINNGNYDRILEIVGLSFSADGPFYKSLKDDRYIYVVCGVNSGKGYEDDEYIVSEEGAVMYRNDEADSFTLTLYGSDVSQSLTAESYAGVTRWDVSPVVRQWMRSELLVTEEKGALYEDRALFAKFRVTGLGGTDWSYTYLAVNAVAQIGETSDMTARAGTALTGFRTIYLYYQPNVADYFLDYSVLSWDEPVSTPQGETGTKAVTRVGVSSSMVGEQEGFGIVIEEACIPDSPFYVRWMNRFGGVDHFMFSRQQKVSSEVKSISSYNPTVEDTLTARTNRRNYALSVERTVTVGAAGLTEDVYRELEMMPYSGRVEWFNEGNRRWTALAVSKFSGERDTKNATFSFEATFNLPDINTHFN